MMLLSSLNLKPGLITLSNCSQALILLANYSRTALKVFFLGGGISKELLFAPYSIFTVVEAEWSEDVCGSAQGCNQGQSRQPVGEEGPAARAVVHFSPTGSRGETPSPPRGQGQKERLLLSHWVKRRGS